MTISRRDGRDTPFSAWVREHPELDSNGNKLCVTDSDLWVHRYSERSDAKRKNSVDIRDVVDSIMMVEIKTFDAEPRYAQRDTLTVIDALLRKAGMVNGRRRTVRIDDARLTYRRHRMVRCFGVHVLQLSGDRPDNSERIIWDGRYFLNEQFLIEMLRFERDPDAPSRALETRRHHRLSDAVVLPLFDDAEVVNA